MRPTLPTLLLIAGAPVLAGPKFGFDDGSRNLEIQQTYQLWGATTFDPVHTPEAAPRTDVLVRRARLSFRGLAFANLDYQFGFAADNVGKDSVTGVGGSPQIPAASTFQVIDAAAWFHALDDRIVAAAGLMTPHLNRELFTSFASVPSLDQAATYSYVRDHITTRNTARETGVALASVWVDTATSLSASLDLGAWDNSWDRSATSAPPTVSAKWSPLLTGRLALGIGDREQKGWKLSSDNSTRTKGWGATLGLFAAWKGEVETKSRKDSSTTGGVKTYSYAWLGGSESSDLYGADLFAWAFGTAIQAEWIELGTTFSDSVRSAMPGTYKAGRTADHAANLRISRTFPVARFGAVEPAACWSWFLADDLSPRYRGGRDEIVDLGLNWLLDGNRTKLSAHYLNNTGSPSTAFTSGPGKAGYAQRSDAVVLGLQLQI